MALAGINVENRAKRKYPRVKPTESTKVRKSFFNAQINKNERKYTTTNVQKESENLYGSDGHA